jgi:cytoskeletal protein CcmA (bactofilin family)
MKKIINRIVRSVIGSSPGVSQICIGNGNIQCRGSVVSGKLTINGKEIDLGNETWIEDELITGDIKIEITGDVNTVDASMGDVTVKGNVTGSVKTSQGNIVVEGNVEGDVKTSMGNITIKKGHSGGNVKTSMGSVNITNQKTSEL